MNSWFPVSAVSAGCFLVLTCFVPGCGGGGGEGVTLEQSVYAQIEGLGDASGSESLFNDAFVQGAAPKDREAYGKHWFQVAGEAVVTDDTATVPVKVFGGVSSSQGGDRAASKPTTATEAQTTWSLQKVGTEWKIKDAPLS